MRMSVPSSQGYAAPLGLLSPTGAGHSPTSQGTRPPDHPEPNLWAAGWHTHGGHQRALLGLQRVQASRKQVRLSLPPALHAPNVHRGEVPRCQASFL